MKARSKIISILIMFLNLYSYSQTYFTLSEHLIADIPFSVPQVIKKYPSRETMGEFAEGDYYIKYGISNTTNEIRKPFIFIEGFDYINSQTPDHYLNLYNTYNNGLISELHNDNFDIIFLDFEHSGDYLQRNAFLVVKLIERINELKVTNEEIIIQGYSLGGVITRYALAYMEQQNIPHNVKLFISHDSPQKGANFPIGIQYSLNTLALHSIASLILYPIYMQFKEWNPATKQIALYHVDGGNQVSLDEGGSYKTYQITANNHSFFNSFFTELQNLNSESNGYPIQLKKIAISNGSNSGIKQTNNGHTIYDGEILLNLQKVIADPVWVPWPFCCGFWCGHGCWTVENRWYLKSRATFDHSLPIAELFAGGKEIKYYEVSTNNVKYDYTPGGYLELENLLSEYIEGGLDVSVIADRFSFIPTFSALDLSIDPFDSFNNTNNICESNFDEIYSESSNKHHFLLSWQAKNFILNNINSVSNGQYFSNANDIVIQNKEFISETAIIKAKHTITTEGEVIIDEHSNVMFIAGDAITLKDGFSTKPGANFTAKITTVDFNNCGQNKNIFAINKPIANIIDIEQEEIYVKKICNLDNNMEVDIFPNPTKDFINIISKKSFISNITIYNSMSSIEINKFYNSKEVEVSLSSLSNGIYFIKITDENNNIYFGKVIKN